MTTQETFAESLRELRAEPVMLESEQETEERLRDLYRGFNPSSTVIAGIPRRVRGVVERALGSRFLVAEELKPGEAVPSIERAELGITWAAYGVAKEGAIVEIVYDDALRLASCLPINHVALLSSKSVLSDLREAMAVVGREVASSPDGRKPVVTFISGPSRTADIEGRLLYGAHGPHSLTVMVLSWA